MVHEHHYRLDKHEKMVKKQFYRESLYDETRWSWWCKEMEEKAVCHIKMLMPLFKLALPLALEAYKQAKIGFTVSWIWFESVKKTNHVRFIHLAWVAFTPGTLKHTKKLKWAKLPEVILQLE